MFFIFTEVDESIKLFCERFPPYARRKGASLSLKTSGRTEESEGAGLTEFPPTYYTWLILCPVLSSYDFPLFIKPGLKPPRRNHYLGLHFFMKAPVSRKT